MIYKVTLREKAHKNSVWTWVHVKTKSQGIAGMQEAEKKAIKKADPDGALKLIASNIEETNIELV